MANNGRRNNVTLEDVRIVFRNFSGKEGQYNREGDRNFAVLLPREVANDMAKDGWNIKELAPREEGDEPQAYLTVKVNFNGPNPPQIVMVTSAGRTVLGPEEVNILDWAEIRKSDLIVSPYDWNVNGKTGRTAYLHKIFVTIEEDELDLKYADVPDSAQKAMTGQPYFTED